MLTLPLSNPEADTIQCQPGVETPVAIEETTAKEISFPTAHLRAELRDREADEAFAAKVTDTADGVKLPETLPETLAMLRQVQASVPKDKFESKVKGIKMERLRGHLHKLSQSEPPPRLNYAAFLKREPPPSALAHFASLYPKAKNRKV